MLSAADILDSLRVVSIPTRTRFRGLTVREAALFEGPLGWAEFSPFPEYDDRESAAWLQAAIDFASVPLPAFHRDGVPVNATIPAVNADAVPGILARFDGCDTVKVKVAERGQTLENDIARVARARELAAEARIRVDANGGWSLAEAHEALAALEHFGIDYAEQPCASVDELAQLRERWTGRIRIAADESVRKADDPLEVARRAAADLIVIKAAPLGGVQRALDIAREAALPAIVSSAIDTSVGISMGVALGCALPEAGEPGGLDGACGLGTISLLEGDVSDAPLIPRGGRIDFTRVAPSPELLDRWRADRERDGWWRDRIRRVHALLDEGSRAH